MVIGHGMTSHEADLDEYVVGPSTTIGEALSVVDRNEAGIVLVTDGDMRLLGTVTDGDVRRGLLRGLTFEDRVADVMNRKPIQVPSGIGRNQLIALMTANEIHQAPIVSRDGRVVDLALLTELVRPRPLGLAAVIMAGGQGTRLRPLTVDTPKPLLPVGDKPLIEHVLDLLRQAGIRDVYISTCYLADQFEAAIGTGDRLGLNVTYLREPRPMGTAGALRLLDSAPSDPFFLMNGDLLTQIDLRAMVSHHQSHEADLTLAVREYQVQVPFGVVETAPNHLVTGIREKPIQKHFVNAGIYLVGRRAFEAVPEGDGDLPMTDLIEVVLGRQGRVAAFPMVESWIDVGRPADFERAQQAATA